MAKLIPARERIQKAQDLIKQACQIPINANSTFLDLEYVAQVKDLLRQARDLVKFIPFSPSANETLKQSTRDLLKKIEETDKKLLHRGSKKL